MENISDKAESDEIIKSFGANTQGFDEEFLQIIYNDLQKHIRRCLKQETSNQPLQTKAIVHEAYLRFLEQKRIDSQDCNRFLTIASRMMREISVDYAVKNKRLKEKDSQNGLPLDQAVTVIAEENGTDLIALDQALKDLEKLDQRQAQIVELKYFGGLSLEQISEAFGINYKVAETDWKMAKSWLKIQISKKE